MWIPSRLVRNLRVTLSHTQDANVCFHVGEVVNHFPKGDIDQNVYLDTKGKNVGSKFQPLNTVETFPTWKH